MTCDTHSGTHVDAPLHILQDGDSVDQLDLSVLNGPCRVVHLPGIGVIDEGLLFSLNLPTDTRRLLLRTDNSTLWSDAGSTFKKDFASLGPEAAHWIVERKIQLVGIDYLSIGTFQQGTEVHKILLNAGVVVLEGLNLADVPADEYELLCLPLKIKGAEGAPARALLRKHTDDI